MKNLATIQRVKSIQVHPNADALELATILGWQVVVKKAEFKVGELVVYIAIDTVLPQRPEFEFLRNKNFRIKPIRLRGADSAGIAFPLAIIPPHSRQFDDGSLMQFHEGLDVTELLDVKHYEKPVPVELAGQAFGSMPGYLIITDEHNLRSYPDAVPQLFGCPYYITRKEDGSSGTFFIKDGEFGVCSRRVHLKDTEFNGFWRMARKYNIENVLKTAFPNMDVAIQGEVIGPTIQKNHLGLKEMDLHLFNVFDIGKRTYLDYTNIVEFTSTFKIPMVPIICEGSAFGYSLEELIKLANEQKYDTGGPAEGIVIRPKESFYSNVLKRAWSGKVLNENYKD